MDINTVCEKESCKMQTSGHDFPVVHLKSQSLCNTSQIQVLTGVGHGEITLGKMLVFHGV